jgi:hypothetical protein
VNVSSLVKASEKYVIDNSPRILSALGVTGTITTAYLAAKASFKASRIIHEAEDYRINFHEKPLPSLDNWDKTKLTWKYYIPAVTSGAATVACIVAANSIGASRYAALAAAYKLSNKSFDEYKSKVLEKMGVKEEQKVRDDIAQENVDRKPPGSQVIVMGDGDVLFYDKYSARYFRSDMHTVKKAMNDINYRVIQDGAATLADFYERIDLPTTLPSEEVGWDHENKFNLEISSTIGDRDEPCIVIDYQVYPMRNSGYPGFH